MRLLCKICKIYCIIKDISYPKRASDAVEFGFEPQRVHQKLQAHAKKACACSRVFAVGI